MNAAEFLEGLRADPLAFLRRHVFYVVGLPSGTAHRREHFPSFRAAGAAETPSLTIPTRSVPPRRGLFEIDEDTASFEGFQTGLAGQLGRSRSRDKFTLRPAGGGAADRQLDAWYVPMSDQQSGAVTSYVVLPGEGGPDIALTSQLSGCTFGLGMAARDGSRIVSHTRPDPSHAGGAAGKAAFGPMADIFDRQSRPGPRAYGNPDNRATIIGLRQQGQWRFFAQTYQTLPNRLLSVERLNG